MQSTQIPSRIQLPFANAGAKNTIPVASQIANDPALASFTDGFPPATRTPLAAGGKPPYGQDFNGVLNQITAIQQFQCAGGVFTYDAIFSAAIGGYPAGAIVQSSAGAKRWMSTADNNTTDPDSGTAANWIAVSGLYAGTVANSAGGTVTLTAADAGKEVALSGTTTGTLRLPSLATVPDGAAFLVKNEGTAAWTVSCNAADSLQMIYANSAASSIPIKYDDYVLFVKGAGSWRLYGTGLAKYSASFAALFALPGYQTLPSGLLLQWGTASSNATGSGAAITFPYSFPTATLQVIASGAGPTLAAFSTDTYTRFGFNLYGGNPNGQTYATVSARYLAIGY
jgi:hypothetical protein